MTTPGSGHWFFFISSPNVNIAKHRQGKSVENCEDRDCEFGFCLEREMACTLPLGALTG